MQKRDDSWTHIFSTDYIDVMLMKKRIFKSGLPEDLNMRSQVWKLLLGYYTPLKNDWQVIDENCLRQYTKYVREIYPNVSSESLDKVFEATWQTKYATNVFENTISTFNLNDDETKRMRTIEKDIIRTVIGAPYNRDEPIRHDLAFRRILFILSLVNGGVSYVQGMNNICNVFYTQFASSQDKPDYKKVEAETFGCMFMLIDQMRMWFLPSFDNQKNGIKDSMSQIERVLTKTDKQYADKLKSIGVGPELFVFRWLTLLCCMEFPLSETLRYWDFFFLDLDNFPLVKATCVGILLVLKKDLLGLNFSQTLSFLQNLPKIEFGKVMKKTKQILKKAKYHIRPFSQSQSSSFLRIQLTSQSPEKLESETSEMFSCSSKTEIGKSTKESDSQSAASEMTRSTKVRIDKSKRKAINFKLKKTLFDFEN
ncbi:hypothetical protein EIN_162190 [Entamoeba invadens IP1]|uniref:Rab-GAP TBC domain-containing protein n=1 Tax=Entamoeba invadens IP1 TaxID=370355 RepID=A0A0A1U4F8_ENTIV|nr:hypothetical protein EIN_162190 [Entamoeba invadens IP1]ELP86585.1 hypothetical protein EIN_162190 [Entamoeba invadens IP1]|eukprot:XP_004185931.1 hypothetical protein EIN_162190 [Entamoeba invadens IP1]